MTTAHDESGFTLIELLVTTVLMVTVLGLTMGTFRNLADASDAVALSSDTNISLRSAVNLITRDLLSAGRGIPVGGISVPSGENAAALVRPSPGNDPLTFPPDPTLPAVSPGSGIGPTIDGVITDIITVLTQDPVLPVEGFELDSVSEDGVTITVAAGMPLTDGPDEVKAGDLMMLTNGNGSTLQMVTAREGQIIEFASGDPMNLNLRIAPQGTIFQLRNDDGSYPPTRAKRVLMISYYLDATQSTRPPWLIRRVNLGTPRVVGVGIDSLQFTYDLVNGTDNPTNVPEPEAPNTPHQIRKANLSLSGRSFRAWTGNGSQLRASLSTQVGLRSLAFVDRYPTDGNQ